MIAALPIRPEDGVPGNSKVITVRLRILISLYSQGTAVNAFRDVDTDLALTMRIISFYEQNKLRHTQPILITPTTSEGV